MYLYGTVLIKYDSGLGLNGKFQCSSVVKFICRDVFTIKAVQSALDGESITQ